MPKTMPKTPTRHKFARYWQTVSPTACADFPQEPWQLLRPDESVVHLEIALQASTGAKVARRVGVSRAAVTQAKHRLDAKLTAFPLGSGSRTGRTSPVGETPERDPWPGRPAVAPWHAETLTFLGGPTYEVGARGHSYTVQRADPNPSAENLFHLGLRPAALSDAPAGCLGFGTLAEEDWGRRANDGPHGRRWRDAARAAVSDADRMVAKHERGAGSDLQRDYKYALHPDDGLNEGLSGGDAATLAGFGDMPQDRHADRFGLGVRVFGRGDEGGMFWEPSDAPTNALLDYAITVPPSFLKPLPANVLACVRRMVTDGASPQMTAERLHVHEGKVRVVTGLIPTPEATGMQSAYAC
jgi:hypothetical protein